MLAEIILDTGRVLQELRAIDASSAVLRVFSVRLFVFNDKNTWIVANINILTNLYNLLQMGFYLKVSTKVFQIAIQAYAWYFWDKQEKRSQQTITHLEAAEYQNVCIGLLIFLPSLFLLQKLMYSEREHIDVIVEVAMITLNYTGLWLSVNRKIECWIIWTMYNAISAYAYYSHDLPCNAIGSLLMLGLACQGYYHWHEVARIEKEAASPEAT